MSIREKIIDYSRGNDLSRFWRLYRRQQRAKSGFRRDVLTFLMSRCAARHGGYIGPDAVIRGVPSLPHGLHGVFISRYAVIGANCRIYQNVTIGEIAGKAPEIGDGCLIGAGAVLVGGIRVGPGAKIGAGAVVHTDVPAGAAALAHNVSVLRGALPPGCELMAVVKADAYGHGMSAVVPQLLSLGVRSFAAATLDEGSQLRALGAEGTVLILGYTSPQRAGELARLGLTQTVADLAHAEALNAQGVPLRVHLKIDTGMHRLGIAWDAPEAASAVFRMENLTVDAIYSHLCCADSLAPGDVSFTREQIRRFYALTAALAAQGISLPKLHLQSSYGLLNYPELCCDYARVGLALYGAAEGTAARSLGLRPVLSLRARVVSVRDVAKGESVGYDRTFTARRKSRIAVLPIGYADGYPRALSNTGLVRIHGCLAPVAGRICMDQLAVDVTDVPGVVDGDIAELIGDASPLRAGEVAARCGTIPNELLSRLGARLPVVIN